MAYTTKQGDTWDMISARHYGDEAHMSTLIAANPRYRDTVIFSAGVLLETPTVTKATTANSLPPWKRAGEVG